MGKITIVKSLIIPHMIYKLSILPVIIPRNFITKIIKLLFKFMGVLIEKESARMCPATRMNLV